MFNMWQQNIPVAPHQTHGLEAAPLDVAHQNETYNLNSEEKALVEAGSNQGWVQVHVLGLGV